MDNLTNIIESIVYVSGKSIAVKDIAEKLEITEKEILDAVKELQTTKYANQSGLQLLYFNKKLQFCSNPDYAEQVACVLNPIKERELSRSMLETAAIIAYKQPVTRIDLEELRGNSEYAIQNLMKLGVIEIVGRKDAVGRPVLFGTTDEFLKRFQISSLDELPDYDELIAKIQAANAPSTDSYLYKKDEYVEETAATVELADDKLNQVQQFDNGGNTNDVDISENISEMEVPDFLKDEDVEIIE